MKVKIKNVMKDDRRFPYGGGWVYLKPGESQAVDEDKLDKDTKEHYAFKIDKVKTKGD